MFERHVVLKKYILDTYVKIQKKVLTLKNNVQNTFKILKLKSRMGINFDLLIWWLDRCLERFIINEILQTIKHMKRLMGALWGIPMSGISPTHLI